MHPIMFDILQELEEHLLQGNEQKIREKKYQQYIDKELPNHQVG